MFYRPSRHLFADGDLPATVDAQMAKVHDSVDAIPRDQFLSSPDQDVIDHIRTLLVVQPITLHEEAKEMERSEVELDVSRSLERNPFGRSRVVVPGFRFVVSVPFTGDPILWRLKPSQWMSVFPMGTIRDPGADGVGYLDIVVELPADSPPETARTEVDRTLTLVKTYLKNQESDIRQRNERLEGQVRAEVQARRQRLEKQDGMTSVLGIPLKKKDGVPSLKPISVERRLLHPLPPPPKSPFKPEPGILEADYEDILTIIRHEGRTFETTPSTYALHDENGLRNIILAHLNGHYKGSATAETFRSAGKTDIRIEDQDRAAFVAECKVWSGSADIGAGLTQLLGYLTWRDCKCALIVFNKHNAGFSELLKALPAALADHPNLHRDLGPKGEGEWRYVFRSLEDEARFITIHALLFNIYFPGA